jgi:drug/metabolite transporter (DMT)-like permease
MAVDRGPPLSRPNDGQSGTPLLHKYGHEDHDRGRPSYSGSPRPSPQSQHRRSAPTSPTTATLSRRSTLRSRSPATNARFEAKKKYTYAAFFLVVSLVAFTVQTELAAYVQRELGWDKAYCMLYLTHGSWVLLWPVQLAVLRLQKRDMPWSTFWRRHKWLLRTTAQMVEHQSLDVHMGRCPASRRSPVPYMLRTTVFVTLSLTVAGLSWYVAVNKTTPSDLTAIYNCSAFFAYAFSVPLLKERLRLDKSIAVAVAIAGVLVVAYGDTKESGAKDGPSRRSSSVVGGAAGTPQELDGSTRFLGNLVIGAGSVLYGLYEVLYKRYACPPDGTSPGRGMIFANTFGSLIGAFTLLVLWIPLPILHVIGWETFELPTGYTAWLLFVSVVMNATFAGSFLVLISLTSPVLSSVAALLTIFIVAVVDWLWTGEPLSAAAIFGGCLIILAFGMLSWSTWREMTEDHKERELDFSAEDDESDKDDD